MTLQAFYQTIHGNYDEPMSRLRKEPFLLKYVKLYAQDTTYQELLNAVAAQDWMEAFRAAHSLRGIAEALGLTPLYETTRDLTEALRGDRPLTDERLLQAVTSVQESILAALAELDAED
mgnify:CR=1 FL=1